RPLVQRQAGSLGFLGEQLARLAFVSEGSELTKASAGEAEGRARLARAGDAAPGAVRIKLVALPADGIGRGRRRRPRRRRPAAVRRRLNRARFPRPPAGSLPA